MPVTCPICGGGHPKWECKKPDKTPEQEAALQELATQGQEIGVGYEKPAPVTTDKIDKKIRTPEELEKALGLPPGTAEKWKARLAKKKTYMKSYMPKWRAKKKEGK